MKWPWSKKESKPPQDAAESKPIEYPEDWGHVVGNWARIQVCHCGVLRKHWDTEVCPSCGCVSRWSSQVSREEWKESPSRRKVWDAIWWDGTPMIRHHPFYCRDVKIVIWTPEHCQKDGVA